MGSQTENLKHKTKNSNPLNDIAANLGVTPKVLTELATGEDKEFRELVRGIFSILPETEVAMVANDPGIHPEFLDYLCKLFDANQKILLTILQNPSSGKQTKQFILDHLPKNMVSAIAQSPKTSPALNRMITERFTLANAGTAASPQTDEFKIKMKVSRLLNDLEANLGVSIDAFLKIKTRDDEQSREFVREVYDALSENHVLIVASDPTTTPLILNYLYRLFDTNHEVLATILKNPTTDNPTKELILQHLPEDKVVSIAGDPKTPHFLLNFLGDYFSSSEDMQMVLLVNPATQQKKKKFIQEQSGEPEIEDVTDDLLIADDEDQKMPAPKSAEEYIGDHTITDFFRTDAKEATGIAAMPNNLDTKIDICVKKLYAINADIVSQFIKKAHIEIQKRLKVVAEANHLVLTAILKNPSLTIEELDNIDMKTFMVLLKKTPGNIDDKTVVKLLQQAKRKKKE